MKNLLLKAFPLRVSLSSLIRLCLSLCSLNRCKIQVCCWSLETFIQEELCLLC